CENGKNAVHTPLPLHDWGAPTTRNTFIVWIRTRRRLDPPPRPLGERVGVRGPSWSHIPGAVPPPLRGRLGGGKTPITHAPHHTNARPAARRAPARQSPEIPASRGYRAAARAADRSRSHRSPGPGAATSPRFLSRDRPPRVS